MRPLRILVAQHVPGTRTGGMSRIMGFIHDRVAARGHEVELFQAEEARAAGVHGRMARFTFPLALRLLVAGRQRGALPFDIVNVHEAMGAALLAPGRGTRPPAVVATSHGLERRAWAVAREEAHLGRARLSPWTRLVYPATGLWQSDLTLRRADHVFCLSEDDRAWLGGRFGAAAPPATRILPGADPGFGDAAAGRDYARADRLLFAGTWRTNKGIRDLVPAFAALAGTDPAVTLTVLGPGVADREVLAAWPAHLRARVQCRHARSDAETMRVFAEHDLFVLPSLFEGTPLTLIEAMASGLPVVTTATCGMKDVVQDGETGLLVPVRAPEAIAAALRALRADAALRARLGRAARAYARLHHTWDVVAGPVIAVYEALAAARGPA